MDTCTNNRWWIPRFLYQTDIWSSLYIATSNPDVWWFKSNKKKKIQRIVAGATNKKSITKSHMLVKLNSGVNGAPTDGAWLKILSTFTTCLQKKKNKQKIWNELTLIDVFWENVVRKIVLLSSQNKGLLRFFFIQNNKKYYINEKEY